MRIVLAALLITIPFVAPAPELRAQAMPGAEAWEIGPIYRGRSRSIGMPLRPSPARRGWFFDFPRPDQSAGSVKYISFNHGPLSGRGRIVMRYRIDAAPGVRFVAPESPNQPATLTLFFQRRGDNFSGRGPYEHYRWWAPWSTIVDIRPGEHQVSVPITRDWVSIFGKTGAQVPGDFAGAIADTQRVGFVLGHRGGRGHGVYATGPARMTVLSFQVI